MIYKKISNCILLCCLMSSFTVNLIAGKNDETKQESSAVISYMPSISGAYLATTSAFSTVGAALIPYLAKGIEGYYSQAYDFVSLDVLYGSLPRLFNVGEASIIIEEDANFGKHVTVVTTVSREIIKLAFSIKERCWYIFEDSRSDKYTKLSALHKYYDRLHQAAVSIVGLTTFALAMYVSGNLLPVAAYGLAGVAIVSGSLFLIINPSLGLPVAAVSIYTLYRHNPAVLIDLLKFIPKK